MADKINWGAIPVLNNEQSDPRIAPQDAQHTTLENVLRLLVKDKFTPDTFKNVKGWQGVVMRVVSDPADFEYSTRTDIEMLQGPTFTPIKYKVFIQNGPGTIFDKPSTYDATPEDKLLIDVLDDYSVSPTFKGVLKEGSVVWITNDNYRDKVIEYSFSPTVDASIATSNTSTVANKPSDSFKQSQQNNGPVNLDKIPDDITEDIAYVNGKPTGKIKLKTIYSYNSARMRVDAANKFNELCKEAAKMGIKIIGVSGFRNHQEQIALYNNRYLKPYPVEPKNNILSSDGRRIGVAAYPGQSNHQSGIAVDIEMGIHKDEKNRYAGAMGQRPEFLWMSKFAKNFGFGNSEGRSVNEPWHWVYEDKSLTSMNDDKTNKAES